MSLINLCENWCNTKRTRKIHGSFLNKNLVFIDSMQFMNSSLDKVAKNLSDDDLNIWHEKSGSANLEVLKQKDSYPHDYMNSFKWFKGKKIAQ